MHVGPDVPDGWRPVIVVVGAGLSSVLPLMIYDMVGVLQ